MAAGSTAGVGSSVLDEIISRVVGVASPKRIILFGSAARGQAGPGSDIDILVVVAGPVHRRRLAQEIHLSFFGIGVPVDVLVATPEDIERLRGKVGTILNDVLEEGLEVYAA